MATAPAQAVGVTCSEAANVDLPKLEAPLSTITVPGALTLPAVSALPRSTWWSAPFATPSSIAGGDGQEAAAVGGVLQST